MELNKFSPDGGDATELTGADNVGGLKQWTAFPNWTVDSDSKWVLEIKPPSTSDRLWILVRYTCGKDAGTLVEKTVRWR
jgi:hypothetical protein